jgi:hypothetical protein
MFLRFCFKIKLKNIIPNKNLIHLKYDDAETQTFFSFVYSIGSQIIPNWFVNAHRLLSRIGLWVFSVSRHLKGRGGRHCKVELQGYLYAE